MTEPMDLMQASQDAAFGWLLPIEGDTVLAAVVGGAVQVFQHVPENTQPPFVVIGEIEEQTESEDAQLSRIMVEVHSVYRGPSRARLLSIMHRVHVAMTVGGIVIDGVNIGKPRLLSGVASEAASDGVTYAGLQTFELLAEPAD